MIGGNDEEELPGASGKVAAGDTEGSGETGPGKLNGRSEVESHRKQESEPGMYREQSEAPRYSGDRCSHQATSKH